MEGKEWCKSIEAELDALPHPDDARKLTEEQHRARYEHIRQKSYLQRPHRQPPPPPHNTLERQSTFNAPTSAPRVNNQLIPLPEVVVTAPNNLTAPANDLNETTHLRKIIPDENFADTSLETSSQTSYTSDLSDISSDVQYITNFMMDARAASDTLLTIDNEIPEFNIPIPEASTSIGPNITIKDLTRNNLWLLKNQYNSLRQEILANELEHKDKTRPTQVQDRINGQRRILNGMYRDALQHAEKLRGIQTIQDSLKPTLKLPLDFRHNKDNAPVINCEEAAKFVGQTMKIEDPQTRLVQTWNKLHTFCKLKKHGHDAFKLFLSSVLSDEHHDYYTEIEDLPLDQITEEMAKRFVTETKFHDALHELQSFKRKRNEGIRITMARLRNLLTKVSVLYPANEKSARQDLLLETTLRTVISKDTLAVLDKARYNARIEGISLSLDQMVTIVDEEERQHGIPEEDRSVQIAINNGKNRENKSQAEEMDSLKQMVRGSSCHNERHENSNPDKCCHRQTRQKQQQRFTIRQDQDRTCRKITSTRHTVPQGSNQE